MAYHQYRKGERVRAYYKGEWVWALYQFEDDKFYYVYIEETGLEDVQVKDLQYGIWKGGMLG